VKLEAAGRGRYWDGNTLKSAKPCPTNSGGGSIFMMPFVGRGDMDCEGDCAREAVREECWGVLIVSACGLILNRGRAYRWRQDVQARTGIFVARAWLA